MATGPELEIDYDRRGIPIAAGCPRAEMPLVKSKGASAEELLKWHAIQFALPRRDHHKKHFHSDYWRALLMGA